MVDGHGEGGAAVAEAFADDLYGDAGFQQDAGVGVAEVVEADASHIALLHQSAPRLREQVGVDRSSIGVREDELVVAATASAEVLLELMASPGLEHGDGAGVEVDGAAAAGGLHVGNARLVVDGLDLLVDDEPSAIEVDVAPGEAEHFTTAHAGVGGEVDGHVPVAVFDAGEELAELVG